MKYYPTNERLRTALARLAVLSQPELRALHGLSLAIAELESVPNAPHSDVVTGLLGSVESLIGPLDDRNHLFSIAHSTIGRILLAV